MTNELKIELKDKQLEFFIKMLAKLRVSSNKLREKFEDLDVKNFVPLVPLESVSSDFIQKKKSFADLYSKASNYH